MTHAARAAKIDRKTHQVWMKKDPVYAEAFNEARTAVLDVYEREIHRRSVEGVDEPVFQSGELVGTIRKYSDVLLIFRTKALAPDRYRDRHHVSAEVTHYDGDSELDREIAGLMDRLGRVGEGQAPVGAAHPNGQDDGRFPRPTGAAHP